MLGPPVLIGDRVAYVGSDEPHLATVRWLGRLPEVFHHQMVAGISLVSGGNINWSFDFNWSDKRFARLYK